MYVLTYYDDSIKPSLEIIVGDYETYTQAEFEHKHLKQEIREKTIIEYVEY